MTGLSPASVLSRFVSWARAPASDQPGLLAWAVSDLALLGMTALCVLSWRKLTIKEYLKTQRQSTWLEEQLAKRGPRHEI